jgi:hypothetical protein
VKNLIFINGVMGGGKTSTCKVLLELLPKAVFLDGDWCWYANPWKVTDETVTMAMTNMGYLLNSFLDCSEYDNIIFGWVLHKEEMTGNVLSMLRDTGYNLHRFTLTCSESTLVSRLQKDIDNNVRKNVSWEHALQTRPNFENMDKIGYIKIATDNITQEQAADIICGYIYP